MAPTSKEKFKNSILKEKKYLLMYHKYRDELHSHVLPVILNVEHDLKKLPPLKIEKENWLTYEEYLRSVARTISGYSIYIAKETIKEGFPSTDFFTIYLEHERIEIALFIFQEQENLFRQTITDTLLDLTSSTDPIFYQYFRNHLLHTFSTMYLQLFKEVFLMSVSNEPSAKRMETMYS